MKLAVLSDIHGNLPALEAVVADARARGCTRFVNLGDSLSGPLWPAETADFLMGQDWPTIAGNHERQLLTCKLSRMNASDAFTAQLLTHPQRAWLAQLPETYRISADILLCHGTPDSDLKYFLHSVAADGSVVEATPDEVAERAGAADASLVLCGHTHLPRLVRLGDGRSVANPGSVGLPAYSDDHPVLHHVSSGSPHARYATVTNGSVEFLAIEYEFERAAAKAEAEARHDWAHALRTGRAFVE